MSEASTSPKPKETINRDAVREICVETSGKGVLFGKDFELTEEKRAVIKTVTDRARETIEPFIEVNEDKWRAFQDLITEGNDKGVLLRFRKHPDSNVPVWCIKGPVNTDVEKVLDTDGQPAIQVPQEIYNIFYWLQDIEAVEGVIDTTNETLFGRTADQLGEPLSRLGHLLLPELETEDMPVSE